MTNLPTDTFCRCVIYPNCTKGNADVLDDAALLFFSPLDRNAAVQTSKALSVVSWDKCGCEDSVHNFGMNTAEKKLARDLAKAEAEGTQLSPGKVPHYLGYYSMKFRHLQQVGLQDCSVLVRHAVEDGDDRHFHVEIHLMDGVEDPKGRRLKADVRILRDQLARMLYGPELLPREHCSLRQSELQIGLMPIKEARDFAVG